MLFLVCAVVLAGCATSSKSTGQITSEPFGTKKDGTPVTLYTLRNNQGAEARIINYGGTVLSLKVPDRHGKFDDVVLGFDTLPEYEKSSPYFGCLIGRYGNRIANGKFTLDGRTYTLATNNGPNALHGGLKGFDKVVWAAEPYTSKLGPAVKLHYVSKDGEEGYPGNLSVTAIYTLTHENELRVDLSATTDRDTVLNLTHHSYFNLAGKGDVLDHDVLINADAFTPVNEFLIPTGEIASVRETPLDFTTPTTIGARINSTNEQIQLGKGYDHNFVVNKKPGELAWVARVSEPTSGRVMEVFSTEPGVQFYTGNFLDGTVTGKAGWVYQQRNGFCFEPQHFPDSPNQPKFPSSVLKPGEVYTNTIIYRFATK